MQAICPQCSKQVELILTQYEEQEARDAGWYVSCPSCSAVFVHHEAMQEENEQAESPPLDQS